MLQSKIFNGDGCRLLKSPLWDFKTVGWPAACKRHQGWDIEDGWFSATAYG
jgi:hypothetical protein